MDSTRIFAGTEPVRLFCSDDGGEHWRETLSGLAPISKGTHYAAFVGA